MDMGFIKKWAAIINIEENVLQQQFEANLKWAKKTFPDQDEQTLFIKAQHKLKVDFKKKFISGATMFEGVIFSADAPKDLWANIRKTQLEKYEKALDQQKKTGDSSLIDNIIEDKIVAINETTGEIIPLCPKYKSNGELSKKFGDPVPTPEEAMSQTVYGVATVQNDKNAKGFVLNLNGAACNQDFHEGKIVRFSATNKTQKDAKVMELNSQSTDFNVCENEYLAEGLSKLGITGMIENFFSDLMVSWEEVNKWLDEKRSNPKKEVIPTKFNRSIMILPESLCVYQNFTPNDKGNIKINICDSGADFDETTVLCLSNKRIDPTIDFTTNSKIIALGRPFLPAPRREGEDVKLLIMNASYFAYPDWKIPRVEVKKLSEKELMDEEPKEKEAPKEAPKESVKVDTKKEEPVATENTQTDEPWG